MPATESRSPCGRTKAVAPGNDGQDPAGRAATDAVERRRPLASGKPFSDGREAGLNDGALAQALRRDEAETAAERVQQELGGADILVNKAGVMLTAPCLGRPGRLLSQGTA